MMGMDVLLPVSMLVRAEDRPLFRTCNQEVDYADSMVAWQIHAPHLGGIDVMANHMTILNRPNIDNVTQYMGQIWDIHEAVESDSCL
jgi:hypothetical protein